MEAVHQLGDTGSEVPPVDIEDIDVVCLELFQARCNAESQALRMVSLEIALDLLSGANGPGEESQSRQRLQVMTGNNCKDSIRV